MQRGDNKIPGLDNEIISIRDTLRCYKIRVKSKQFKSILGEDRTFTIEFFSKTFNQKRMPPPRAIFYATSFESSFGVDTSDFSYGNPQIIEIVLNHHSVVELKPKQYHLIKEKSGCVEKTKYEIIEEWFAKNVLDMCPNPCSPFLMPNETLPVCTVGVHTMYDWNSAKDVHNSVNGKYVNYAPLCSRTDYNGYFIEVNKPIKGRDGSRHVLA